MRIITGSTGKAHITAADDGALHAAIIGAGRYVFPVGSQFKATLLSAVAVQLADGEGILQGRHFRTEPDQVDSVTIEVGTEGLNRNDIIGLRYAKVDAVESISWEVITGTGVTGEATDPDYVEGDLLNGDTEAFMPMYRVKLTGLTLAGIEAVYTTVPSITELIGALAAVATSGKYSDLTGKPSLAAVATSGSYNDLTDKPSAVEIDVDDTVTSTGTNPVSGKAVYEYIASITDYEGSTF